MGLGEYILFKRTSLYFEQKKVAKWVVDLFCNVGVGLDVGQVGPSFRSKQKTLPPHFTTSPPFISYNGGH